MYIQKLSILSVLVGTLCFSTMALAATPLTPIKPHTMNAVDPLPPVHHTMNAVDQLPPIQPHLMHAVDQLPPVQPHVMHAVDQLPPTGHNAIDQLPTTNFAGVIIPQIQH